MSPRGCGLMKKTTGDLWWWSRPGGIGIRPSLTRCHSMCAKPHSSSTLRKPKEFDAVKWVTDPSITWSTNDEIRECSGWPEIAATCGNVELAWPDGELVDFGRSRSLDSCAVCNEHRSGTSAGRHQAEHHRRTGRRGRGCLGRLATGWTYLVDVRGRLRRPGAGSSAPGTGPSRACCGPG